METIIIGGGLAGLFAARLLEGRGSSYRLLEARERLGGRVLTTRSGDAAFDLGPTWFWREQPRICRLVAELGLPAFEQYSIGDGLSEPPVGAPRQGPWFASMRGSLRLSGGIRSLTDRIAAELDQARISTGVRVTSLHHQPDGVRIAADGEDDSAPTSYTAQRVILAVPPRVVVERIALAPDLSENQKHMMSAIPTWMAGHAKVVAVYDRPFWREQGLSGDAGSARGPLAEIHDASPSEGGPFALFGFVGTPADARLERRTELLNAAVSQLARLFGPDAAAPSDVLFHDWAHEPWTSTQADHQPLRHHPAYGLPSALEELWDGRLLLASSEVASEFGGYLEGALCAAARAVDAVQPDAPPRPTL